MLEEMLKSSWNDGFVCGISVVVCLIALVTGFKKGIAKMNASAVPITEMRASMDEDELVRGIQTRLQERHNATLDPNHIWLVLKTELECLKQYQGSKGARM